MQSSAGIVVQKFGGSSLASAQSVARVSEIIADAYRERGAVVVVVSARGKATDELLQLADSINPSRPARETDQLLATGEIVSAALMAAALLGLGVPATSLTGAQAGISAAGQHGAGVVARIDPEPLRAVLARGEVAVVAGFQGVDDSGNVLTLGRGGSDTTAVALAAALGARQCEIYTDVDGIYSADPRLVPAARLLSEVPALVMAEMSLAGAKVMHSRATELAALTNVDIRVRSSLTEGEGTRITVPSRSTLENQGAVMAITHDLAVTRILVRGRTDLARDVFAVLSERASPVDLVARSGSHEAEFRMGFTIPEARVPAVVPALRAALERHQGQVEAVHDVGKVSLVGTGLLNRPELVVRMLQVLDGIEIATSWISATQLRTSVTVPRSRVGEAVARLHDEFALSEGNFDISGTCPA